MPTANPWVDFHTDDGGAGRGLSFSTADWMQQLKAMDPSIKLRDLVIPGTHDSASVTISGWKPFSGVGQTQNLSVYDQLCSGARYLDIRMADNSAHNGVSIWHGCLEGCPFDQVLEEIHQFADAHKGEFLLLELVPEYGKDFSPQNRLAALQKVHKTFDSSIIRDFSSLLGSYTLADIKPNQSVAVLVHPRFYSDFAVDGKSYQQDEVKEAFGFFNSHAIFRSVWHNTRNLDNLLEGNLQDVRKHGANKAQWHAGQFLLTPGVGGASDVVQALIGQNSLRPVSQACRLYQPKVLDTFLRDHATESWNWILLDFIDLCPATVHFILALNVPIQLEIFVAAVKSNGHVQDVTTRIKTFVQRGRVLFSPNLMNDLQVGPLLSSLTVAYRLGEEFRVVTISIEIDTMLLISALGTSQCDSNVIVPSNKEGYVGGRGLTQSAQEAIVKYEYKNKLCEFELVAQ
jgi:hypothetical protein